MPRDKRDARRERDASKQRRAPAESEQSRRLRKEGEDEIERVKDRARSLRERAEDFSGEERAEEALEAAQKFHKTALLLKKETDLFLERAKKLKVAREAHMALLALLTGTESTDKARALASKLPESLREQLQDDLVPLWKKVKRYEERTKRLLKSLRTTSPRVNRDLRMATLELEDESYWLQWLKWIVKAVIFGAGVLSVNYVAKQLLNAAQHSPMVEAQLGTAPSGLGHASKVVTSPDIERKALIRDTAGGLWAHARTAGTIAGTAALVGGAAVALSAAGKAAKEAYAAATALASVYTAVMTALTATGSLTSGGGIAILLGVLSPLLGTNLEQKKRALGFLWTMTQHITGGATGLASSAMGFLGKPWGMFRRKAESARKKEQEDAAAARAAADAAARKEGFRAYLHPGATQEHQQRIAAAQKKTREKETEAERLRKIEKARRLDLHGGHHLAKNLVHKRIQNLFGWYQRPEFLYEEAAKHAEREAERRKEDLEHVKEHGRWEVRHTSSERPPLSRPLGLPIAEGAEEREAYEEAEEEPFLSSREDEDSEPSPPTD